MLERKRKRDGFIENLIQCSHSALTKIKAETSLLRSLSTSVNEPLKSSVPMTPIVCFSVSVFNMANVNTAKNKTFHQNEL